MGNKASSAQLPVTSASASASAKEDAITTYDKMRDAADKAKEAEKIILVSTVASISYNIAKSVAGIGIVAASVNPVVLPVVAGAALAVAVVLRLKAGHTQLIGFLGLRAMQFVDVIDFISLAEHIIAKMKGAMPNGSDMDKYDFKSREVQQYAEIFRTTLIAISPPSVLEQLQKTGGITDSPKVDTKSSIRRFFTKTIGTINRVAYSGAMIDSVAKKFQDLINACHVMESRFFLFLDFYRDEFEAVASSIKGDTVYAKAMYKAINRQKGLPTATPSDSEADPVAVAKALENGVVDATGSSLETVAAPPNSELLNAASGLVTSAEQQATAAVETATVAIAVETAGETGQSSDAALATIKKEVEDDAADDQGAANAASTALEKTGKMELQQRAPPVYDINPSVAATAVAAGGGKRKKARKTRKAKKAKKAKKTKKTRSLNHHRNTIRGRKIRNLRHRS
jgi:hypothetical protein